MEQIAQAQMAEAELEKVAEQMSAAEVANWCEDWLLNNAEIERLADLIETIMIWDPKVRDELEYRQQAYEEGLD